jgi:IS5 family transposase
VPRIAATGRRIQAAGGATRTKLRDRSQLSRKRAHHLESKLRLRRAAGKDAARTSVYRVTGERCRTAANQTPGGHCTQAARLAACGEHDPAAVRRRGRSGVFVDWFVD